MTPQKISHEEPERLLREFSHEVRRGGFARLLFNLRGENLAETEDTLIAAGARRA